MNRAVANFLFVNATRAAALAAILLLCALLATLVFFGAPALSFDFLLTPSRNFGAAGGIYYQILGTLLLVAGAGVLCLPLALGTAIYLSEYVKSQRWQRLSALLILSLNGVPSIIFGLFGLLFFVNFLGTGISWFAGSLVLAVMILPTVVMAAHSAMQSIPVNYREAGLALGLTKGQMIRRVVLPQSRRGVITGLLLGLARAAGETAPIMFIATAFSGAELPSGLFEPVAALPTHILTLAQQATDPKALQNAWGASLTLILIVFILGFSSLIARWTFQPANAR